MQEYQHLSKLKEINVEEELLYGLLDDWQKYNLKTTL